MENLAVPGSRLGFTRHSICAEQAAYGLLAHKIFGAPAKEISTRKLAAEASGVRSYQYAEFITHRTEDKFVSFSWKNKIMGMLIPIGARHESNPHFTPPIANGMVGAFELSPAGDQKVKVVEHDWKETANGFETTGTLLMNGERLKQWVKVTSIGKKTVVYQDRVMALTNVVVVRERGVPLGIENDKITGGTRTVTYAGGKCGFDFQKPQAVMKIEGSWANVDGRLGLVSVEGSGLSYEQATGYHPGMAVCADVLYGSFLEEAKHFKAGDKVAQRVVVLFAEVTAKQTAALAKTVKILDEGRNKVVCFDLPEGGNAKVHLQ